MRPPRPSWKYSAVEQFELCHRCLQVKPCWKVGLSKLNQYRCEDCFYQTLLFWLSRDGVPSSL